MQIRTLAVALFALSPIAFAANPWSNGQKVDLGRVVAQMESRYPAKVVAIEFDASGDKAPHYHVDMRFTENGVAKLDVDAATLEVAAREPSPVAEGSVPLIYATAMITGSVPGQVIAAQLDATNGVPPHYDVDVRLPQGTLARLKVDAATRQIGWRTPAIITD